MKQNRLAKVLFILFVALSVILVSGCAPALTPALPTLTHTPSPLPITFTPERTATLIPSPTLTLTSTPIPTLTLAFEIPKPKEGRGVVLGRVLRTGEPVSYTGIQLCSEFDKYRPYDMFSSPCQGIKYKTETNSDGYYIFSKVQPGGYQGIVVFLPNNRVFVIYSITTDPVIVSVEAGQIEFFDDILLN